jgi:hypothetical protein
MIQSQTMPCVPRGFKPPIVKCSGRGQAAFFVYNWYFEFMANWLKNVRKVFLVPCAMTKPIHKSSAHCTIYQRYAEKYAADSEVLVVSEPVVLIRYDDLSRLGRVFHYDFPPRLLNDVSRATFVTRLAALLRGRDVAGCLPSHHAKLVNLAIGSDWKNYWRGDLFQMMRRGGELARRR